MRPISFLATLAVVAAVVALPSGAAWAQSNCKELRANIVKMDAEASDRPGYLPLRSQLNSLYEKLCSVATPERGAESWYTIDGKKIGPAPGTGWPDQAAYSASDAVAAACQSAPDPVSCAVLRGASAMCISRTTGKVTAFCEVLGAYPTEAGGTPPPPLPPIAVTINNKPMAVPARCAEWLAEMTNYVPPTEGSQSQRNREAYSNFAPPDACQDILPAIEERLGMKYRNTDALPFLDGMARLARAGFAPPRSAAAPNLPPKEFCDNALKVRDQCKVRWDNMRTATEDNTKEIPGSAPFHKLGEDGQAGAFGDCYWLYNRVYGMCKANADPKLTPRAAAATPPPPQAAPPAKPDPNAPQKSSMPPPAPQKSPCEKLVSDYVGAAQSGDGTRALAGYNALKQAGGCGVLDKVDRPLPPAPAAAANPNIMAPRGQRPGIAGAIGACDQSADGCAGAMRQLEAGAGADAQARMIGNAIQIGLQLGAAMAQGLAIAMPQGGGGGASGGGGTNYNSIGNRRVRSTYGEGSPDVKCPPGGCTGR